LSSYIVARHNCLSHNNTDSVFGIHFPYSRVAGEKVKTSLRIFFVYCYAFALCCTLPLRAQNPPENSDPPGRVARLSFMSGSVSFEPAGENDWSAASLNYPVSSADRLWTDKDGRAELETGNLAIRMAGQTDLTATSLTDQLAQFGLAQGTVRVTAYDLRSGNEVEVDTPNAAVTVVQAGDYRIETYSDQNRTLITVNRGEVQVTGNDLNQTVGSGQTLEVSGTNPPQAAQMDVPPSDDFDHWCNERDQKYLRAKSRQYVSPYVPGYYDLDEYGGWDSVPQYGAVWYPSGLPAGWAPYRYGRWAWVEPWGWTWVDQAPWGFAPFHYGRWLLVGSRWGWIPGPVAVAPIYGPAFVAFAGGPGFAASFGIGAVVGWFPLGPGEPFFPWYHHSDGYLRQINVTNVRNINVTNITNITNVTTINNIHYRYQTVAGTAVPAAAFRSSEPVHNNIVKIPPAQFARAQVIPHPEVNPTGRALSAGTPVTHPPVPPQRPRIVQHPPVGRPGQPAVAAHNAPPPENRPPNREVASTPAAHENVAHPPAPNQEASRGNPPPASNLRPPPSNANERPPAANERPPVTNERPPAANEKPPVTAAAHPPEANRGGPPASRPPLVSKYPPPQEKLPMQQKAPAMEQHPGRPLEPQQRQNLHEGKPAGPMADKEFPQHSAPAMQRSSAPAHSAPPPAHEGGPPPKH
jgi:hypothetical protein